MWRSVPDGRWIVTGNQRGDVTVWDAMTGQIAHTLATPNGSWVDGWPSAPTAYAWPPEQGRIVTIYDATRWGESPSSVSRHKTSVRASVAFSPDGRWLVVPGGDRHRQYLGRDDPGEGRMSAPTCLCGHTAQVWAWRSARRPVGRLGGEIRP